MILLMKTTLKKATSNIKIYQILSSLSLGDMKIYLRNRPLSSDIGTVNIQPTKGTY